MGCNLLSVFLWKEAVAEAEENTEGKIQNDPFVEMASQLLAACSIWPSCAGNLWIVFHKQTWWLFKHVYTFEHHLAISVTV